MSESLLNIRLFKGYSPDELNSLLSRLGAARVKYSVGESLCCDGDPAAHMLVVLSGRVNFYDGSIAGSDQLICSLMAGGLIGISQFAGIVDTYQGMAVAVEPTEVLRLDLAMMQDAKYKSENSRFFDNLFTEVVDELMHSLQKCAILGYRTLADRVMLYLSLRSSEKKSNTFTLPCKQSELAEYLCVNHCSLSTAMSALKKEGRIKCKGRQITIVK